MRGLTLAAPQAIVIPSAPAAYRKGHTVERHPLMMTAAELRCLREVELGLSIRELAKALGLNERNVYRWEGGEHALARDTADKLAALVAYTEAAVKSLVAAHEPGEAIATYRADEAFREHVDTGGLVLSAQWHRAVAWRAAQQISGATIVYRA